MLLYSGEIGDPCGTPKRPGLTLTSCQLIASAITPGASPCCCWSTLHACRRLYPGRSEGPRSLVLSPQRRPSRLHGGLAPALIVSRPAQRSLTLQPALPPRPLRDPLHP